MHVPLLCCFPIRFLIRAGHSFKRNKTNCNICNVALFWGRMDAPRQKSPSHHPSSSSPFPFLQRVFGVSITSTHATPLDVTSRRLMLTDTDIVLCVSHHHACVSSGRMLHNFACALGEPNWSEVASAAAAVHGDSDAAFPLSMSMRILIPAQQVRFRTARSCEAT